MVHAASRALRTFHIMTTLSTSPKRAVDLTGETRRELLAQRRFHALEDVVHAHEVVEPGAVS